MNRLVNCVALSWAILMSGTAHAAPINYADGDLAPQGAPDGVINKFFISQSCAEVDGCNATLKTKPPVEYSLIWSDEFDGTQLDPSNWTYETGYGGFGWGNGEWQNYTSAPDNVSVSGGNLVISAQCATAPVCNERDGSITSGRIKTEGRFQFKYGKIQARIQVPVGQGSWPAFWMLGGNFAQVGWPETGEIDVMEINQRYSDQYTTHFTMHWDDGGWVYTGSSSSLFPVSLGDGFHIYEVEWDSDKVVGRIDGNEVGTIAIQPDTMDEFLKEFFAILNVAVGGTLGGPPDASTTWPQTMLVDYVRVYQADGGEGTFSIGGSSLPTPQAAVYSESHSAFLYGGILDSVNWGGNSTATDTGSTAVAPYDGSNVLAANFVNSNKGYGGFIFNFGSGLDFSAYQTLKFAVDTSAMTDFADLGIKMENPGGSPAATVMLSSYMPTLSSNWSVYNIPVSDFAGVDLANVVYLGFWNPLSTNGQLTFGTLYVDDVYFDVYFDAEGDVDEDGVSDLTDNCTLVANPSQCDGDGDGFGNHCDADFNGDGIVNGLDIGPLKASFGTTDAETDLNCDGIVNGLDIGPLKAMFGTAPGPSGLVP